MKVSERISILANVLEVACSRPNNEVGKLVKAVVSIRGHNVNAAISPQYAKGLSALGTRPGVTLSWTSAQGLLP